jgi:putative transposase
MSQRGCCWDNEVAELFFSLLKKERIRKCIYKIRADIFDYIEVLYNRSWCHSHLDGVSPEYLPSEGVDCHLNRLFFNSELLFHIFKLFGEPQIFLCDTMVGN